MLGLALDVKTGILESSGASVEPLMLRRESRMAYTIEHRKYHHQVENPQKYPGTAPYWVMDGEKHVAIIREVVPHIADLSEERGFDLRLDCRMAPAGLRAQVDAYFAPRKVTYLEHPEWRWNDRGESTKMPWGV